MPGVSVSATGRGGADAAIGDTALSQVENPATLSLIPPGRERFDFSGELLMPVLRWQGPLDDSTSSIRAIPLAHLAYGNGATDRLSWGIALNAKSGLATDYRYRPLLMAWREVHTQSDLKNLSLSLHGSVKATDRLFLGAGIRTEFTTADFRAPLAIADVKFGRGYAYGIGFDLGVFYRASDVWTFGAGYRSPTWCTDLAGGHAEASILFLPPIGLGDANINEMRHPQKVYVGTAYDVTSRLKLVGEVRWINYSNSSWNSLTVATDGIIDLRIPLPLGYKDQYILIAGAEYSINDHWTTSVGYNYCTNPIRKTHLFPIGSVLTQHHLTMGLRYRRDRWWVGAGYCLGFTAAESGDGASRIPLGVDYAQGRLTETVHSVGVGFGFEW